MGADQARHSSENRPEWTITGLANLCLGGVTVPIYTTLTAEQIGIHRGQRRGIRGRSTAYQYQKIAPFLPR
jgi:hypothetical protein